nr:nucleotide-binding alpha-beta plait domain-containing protein [Tanacetum cinerariifolium]
PSPVGPRLRTEDRTEMVRSSPGRSGPGRSSVRSDPTRHNLRVFGKIGPDRTDRTEDRICPKPRTSDRTEIRSSFLQSKVWVNPVVVFISMGSYRTKEDDVARISTSVYITNFLEATSAKELFQACNQYGHVVDSFIPNKNSKIGKRFGFVRFINVFSEE